MKSHHPSRTDLASFFGRVNAHPDSCWMWTGCINGKGYGAFRSGFAHRWAYEWFVGPIEKGFEVHHVCGATDCVNPSHLEALNRREHRQRGSYWWLRNECLRGHKLTEDNTYRYTVNGIEYRTCRRCRRASQRRWLERRQRWNAATVAHWSRRAS